MPKAKTTKPKLSAALKKRNAEFKAATAANKRVMIAKDVLAQLKLGKIIAQRGIWAYIKTTGVVDKNEQVCNIIDKKGTICKCCALGSMLVSEIRMNDNIAIKQVDDFEKLNNSTEVWLSHETTPVKDRHSCYDYPKEDRIRKYFSEPQLDLIEKAFEQYDDELDLSATSRGFLAMKSALRFGQGFKTDHDCLVGIMKNIVANKGLFKP